MDSGERGMDPVAMTIISILGKNNSQVGIEPAMSRLQILEFEQIQYFVVWCIAVNPFPKRQILDSSKLKDFADENFIVDENGGKFFKRIENTVGKGEIARYEQFLLFTQCFQKTCTTDT